MTLPLDLVGGTQPVTVTVERSGVTLATADVTPSFELPKPPTAMATDHLDWGDNASENAHEIMAAPNSGTSSEAGLTRRYAHGNFPGSWYSATFDVPTGQPFILRSIETYDKAITKKYNVYVDDQLVTTQLVPRTESGQGIKVYDLVLSGPAVDNNDGNVRIKFEYPLDGSGFGDPSLADTWVLPVPADTQAPDVSAVVTGGTVGDNGWYRSDAVVSVSAVDNRAGAPVVETGESAGWQPYVGPVTVSGEGEHELSFRARDAAGNSTGARTLEVGIDATAPTTSLKVARGTGVDGSDRATLAFTAADTLSGVAATAYRIDGGDWKTADGSAIVVTGYGDHTVDYASTDVAGNPETMRHAVISLADVDTVAAVLAPQVSGAAKIGSTLTSTTGTWNTKGLTFSRQWLRSGAAIPGATAATYKVSGADVGKRLSVRVTATKAGKVGRSDSTSTAPVAKAASSVTATVSRTSVKAGKQVKVAAAVKATGVAATGKVAVLLDGKVVKTLSLSSGKASSSVTIKKKGKHTVVVRYLGSAVVAASTSAPRTVRAR